MTTGSDIQTAINRLVRRRQRRQPKVTPRPPVLGSSGEGDTGSPANTDPPIPASLVYLPLADEAVHGWGAPFENPPGTPVNPPMGTVQALWDPGGQQAYRLVENPGTGWQVTHQSTTLGCGSKWWKSPTRDKVVSWIAIADWRDVSASEASVPSGYVPIFEDGDVLTWIWPGAKVIDATHDGTYLYLAYIAGSQDAYVVRTPITLGGGFQTPTWETTGSIALPAPEGTSYETFYMSLRDDGAELLLNVLSIGRAAPGWDLISDNFRYYEEWTVDLASFPAYSAVKTGDASATLANSWDDTQGKTPQEARDLVNASTRGFVFANPPMANPRFESQVITYQIGSWTVDAFLQSWYDRETQAVQRYTARINVEYEQAVPASIYYTEDEDVALPPAPGYAWCEEISGGGGQVCVVDTVTGNQIPRIGEWRHEQRKLYAQSNLDLMFNGTIFDTVVLLDHMADYNINEGFFVNWATTDTLPCQGGTCGDSPPGMQRLIFTPAKVNGEGLHQYGLPYPGNVTIDDKLDYHQRNPTLVGYNGDYGDVRGNLLQYAHEYVRKIEDDVDQLAPGKSNIYWRVVDLTTNDIAQDILLDQTRNDVAASSSPQDPPTDGKHFITASPPTQQEWSEWIREIFTRFPLWRLFDDAHHHQPIIRLPNETIFVSFGLYDNFPTMQPQTIVYSHEFSGADLRTLTGLDQVTATNERYAKLLENGDSGSQIIIPGVQGIAGVI